MLSLTHDEAVNRARLLTVRSYLVDLDLTCTDAVFESVSTVRFDCALPGSTSFAELVGRLRSATLNGRELPLECQDNRLPLPDLAASNELVVHAELDFSHTGQGLHRFVDPADGETYLYAMSFLDNAQRIFCCFDQPDLKAPLTLSVTAPSAWTVLSHEAGTRTGQVTDGGAARWEFPTTRPIATYMMTVCAGPYHSRYRTHEQIRIGWHCRRSLAEHLDSDTDELFTVTGQCFDAYHAMFGVRYPFGDSYDQVFVPEFNAGAMENPGCVTFRDELLFRSAVTEAERESRAAVVAHEMAHMWFGDLVTMRWWDDLWLNESFATYLAYRILPGATRFRHAWAGFAGGRKLHGYRADQSSWTHPVAPDTVVDAAHALLNFDAISYPKGASVLRQLAAWLGDERFLAGLRLHFERHAYDNATLADLFDSLSAASGQDLADWASVWLRRSGVNTLVPATQLDADGRYTAVTVTQTAPDGVPLRPQRIDVGLYRCDDGALTCSQRVGVTLDPASDGGSTPVPELTGTPAADLLLLNDGDFSFATVRFLPGELDRLSELLPAITDPLARALLWGAGWDLVQAAEWPAQSFVELVVAGVGNEPQLGVVRTMLRYAREFVADRYLPPGERDDTLGVLGETCRSVLATAGPGSGRQLAAARGVIDCTTPATAGTMLDWLTGRGLPDGLHLDAELRWSILRRLVVLERAGSTEIDAELARDGTAQGAVHAVECRAALPDAAAKDTAWTAMMTDRSLTNRHLEALGQGFWQPEQATVTAPYVPRFAAEIVAATDGRDAEMTALLPLVGYPRFAVMADTVRDSERLLATPGLAPAVHRSVTMQTDELRTALRAREYVRTHDTGRTPTGAGKEAR